MSKNYVLKSLYDFLNANLGYYITYDAKMTDLKDVNDLKVDSDIIYTSPNPIDEIVLYSDGILFTSAENLAGRYLIIVDEFDNELGRDIITGVDSITKGIEVETGFAFDILTTYKMVIEQKSCIYMKTAFGVPMANTRLHNMGQRERFDFYVKVKDDSSKQYINSVMQKFKDVIFGNNCNFKIYNDVPTQVGYGRVLCNGYEEIELMDISNDIQSFMISFSVEYWIKYK